MRTEHHVGLTADAADELVAALALDRRWRSSRRRETGRGGAARVSRWALCCMYALMATLYCYEDI